MAGLKFVGGEYTEDGNTADLVSKLDVDSEFQSAPVGQGAVGGQIQAAVANYATQQSVNTALNGYAQSNYLTSGNTFTMEITGSNITGTYTLSYGGQSTNPIVAGATGTQIQAALQGLSNITGVTVAGLTGGPYVIALSSVTPSTLTALSGLTNGTIVITQSPLIPASWDGQSVAPLNSSGVIPAQFIPSFGVGYVSGPYGSTATFSGSTGATPLKIADWAVGTVGLSFQPMCFMRLLVDAASGGRPVVEVRMGTGTNPTQTYGNQTLVARGVGRGCWNDQQEITVLPIPAATGHTGLAGTGYPPTYNAWLSAWVYDANAQSVTINSSNIYNASVYFIRYQT
jgi:hypothetical protein